MTPKKEDEIILAVEREKLFENEALVFQGGTVDEQRTNKFMKNLDDSCISRRRGDLEEDPKFKQPIPYVLIKRGEEFFVYERLKAGGEARLFGKISLGVGGHMNPIDRAESFRDLFEDNMRRELKEEVEITSNDFEINIVGFINDDTDDVGKVHVGVLALIELPDYVKVKVKETHKLRGFWATREELESPEYYNRLENWSKIALQSLK